MTRVLRYYHYGLLFYVTFVYFLNIPGYLSMPGYASYVSVVPTVLYGNYFIAVVFASLFILVVQSPRNVLTSKVLVWCAGYLMVSVVWNVFGRGESQVLVQRLTGLGYLVAFVLLCAGDDKVRAVARWAIVAAVLLAVANNVYDFINPFYFTPMSDVYSNPGRAAGFYINANRAGAALLVGAVLTVTMISEKLRVAYMLLVAVGVLLTFSRMAILGFALVAGILLLQRKLAAWKLMLGAVCLVAGAAAIPAMSYYESLGGGSRSNIEQRVEWLARMGQVANDDSMEERRAVSSLAVRMILERPLLGNGLGSTTAWSERSGTHSMYLTNMAEYGVIIGILILPLLVLACTWGARGEARQIAVGFGATILFVGLFSHNVLDEHYYLIGFALMASITSSSSLERRPDWARSATPRRVSSGSDGPQEPVDLFVTAARRHAPRRGCPRYAGPPPRARPS